MLVDQPSLALSILSGSRPVLLEQTLTSFKERVFGNFVISEIFANIDLWGGTKGDQLKCSDLILSLYPSAVISMPSSPSYGSAIQWLWSQPSNQVILHLEDDWLALEDIHPGQIFPVLNDDVGVITLASKEHHPRRQLEKYGDLFYRDPVKRKFFGLNIKGKIFNKHGVSPGFFQSNFAFQWAKLLNPELDPEKQVHPDINPDLFNFLVKYRRLLLLGENEACLIQDIGRTWRESQGLEKIVSNGKSIWVDNKLY
jgi:hypothetical protein